MSLLVAIGWLAVAGCASAPGTASTTPDNVTRAYVALAHSYWVDLQAADGISGGVNLAAQSCLGAGGSGIELVDPPTCRARAVALVAVQRRFLSDLATVVVPQRFADQDQVLRTKLPTVITDLNALIVACDTNNKQKVMDAANVYVGDMIPDVTLVLDTIDPSVVHD